MRISKRKNIPGSIPGISKCKGPEASVCLVKGNKVTVDRMIEKKVS